MVRWASEFIGTFFLVFFGTGAIVIGDAFPGTIPHFAIAAAFGLVVMTTIYALGDLSGAHINPAVTIAFWLARRLPGRDVAPYVASQMLGALAASGILRALYPAHRTLGATLPAASVGLGAAVALEIILSFALMFVILHVAQGSKEKGIMAGIAIGGTVALAALVAGPLTGASMNPARSLGPAILSGQLADVWIYIVGPIAGTALAVLSCRILRDRCCTILDTDGGNRG
jgi:aquaporin Z